MKRKSTCPDASVLDLGEYLLRSEAGKILLRRGYVIIPHCIPKQQIAEHVDSVKQLSLHQTPNDHNNGKFHGNCTDPRLVHCEESWITRLCTLPSFASILGMPMTDIVLSVDGVAIGTQATHRKESNAKYTCDMPYWVHVDVSAKELLTSEFRVAAHVQGYLCGSGGSSPVAHSTYLRVPHGGDVQSWVDDLRHYFQDDLKKYPKSSSTSVYFRHIPECMTWIQWTTSGVKPVLQDGDLLLWLSALPHAATAGSPNPDLESWRRTQQRVGWFITSHLKILCPKPDLLRQRAFKIIDGKVQGHRIFTTRCVMGQAHPQVPNGYWEVVKSVAGLPAPPDLELLVRKLVRPDMLAPYAPDEYVACAVCSKVLGQPFVVMKTNYKSHIKRKSHLKMMQRLAVLEPESGHT